MESIKDLINSMINGLNILTPAEIRIIGENLARLTKACPLYSGGWERSDLLHYLNSLDPEIDTAEVFLFLGLVTGVNQTAKFYKERY